MNDSRFLNGDAFGMHKNVGRDPWDFRAKSGSMGPGSLQVALDREKGGFHIDVNRYCFYEGAKGWMGHTFVEVILNLGWAGIAR